MSTVAQLNQQVAVAQQAVGAGKISQADFNKWMTNQSRLIAEASAREHPVTTQPTTVQAPPSSSSPVSPMPNEYWSQPTAPAQPSAPRTVDVVQGGTTWETTITPPTPPPQNDTGILGLIGAVAENPSGMLGVGATIVQATGDAAAKSSDPLTQAGGVYLQATSGSMGEIANQGTGLKNAVSNLTGGVQLPTPYTPTSDAAKVGQAGTLVTELVATGIVTGGLAPAGAGAAGVATAIATGPGLGAALNVGISEGVKFAGTGQFSSPVQILEEAVGGAAFGTIGQGALAGGTKLAEAGIPIVSKGAELAVGNAVGRTVTFAGVGAVTGYAENPTPEGALIGAGTGALFSAGGELIGKGITKIDTKFDISGKLANNIPVPKFASVDVPLANGESVGYKGLYISKGSEATPIFGKMSPVTEGVSIEAGYMPRSNIESKVTLDVMGKAGYDAKSIEAINDVRNVMSVTQNTRPTNIDMALPKETGTLNEKGVSVVKDFITSNKGQVEMVYGSYATKPQLSTKFEYSLEGKSALRTPGDIDVQLNTNQSGAETFASDLVGKLKLSGADVRISPEKATLIEANVGEAGYAHAVDIHFKGEVGDVLTPSKSGDVRWGFNVTKKPVTIEDIPSMALNEQGLRKGGSIARFGGDQKIGPYERADYIRNKDVPDFFQAQRTLLESMPKGKTGTAFESMDRLKTYYKVEEGSIGKAPETFVYKPPVEKTSPYLAGIGASSLTSVPILSPSKQTTSSPIYGGSSKSMVSTPIYTSPSSPTYFSKSPKIADVYTVKGTGYSSLPKNNGGYTSSPIVKVPSTTGGYPNTGYTYPKGGYTNVPSPSPIIDIPSGGNYPSKTPTVPKDNTTPSPTIYNPNPSPPSSPPYYPSNNDPFPQEPSPPPYYPTKTKSSTKLSLYNPYGNLAMENPSNGFISGNRSGITSAKRQYGILSADEFLGGAGGSKAKSNDLFSFNPNSKSKRRDSIW